MTVSGRQLRRSGLLSAHTPAGSLPQSFRAPACLPHCAPALQVLLIIAATHLDAVAFQIFSQSFKLVPTALFAYWLLGQTLAPMQVRQRCGEAWSGMQGKGRHRRSGPAAALCPPGLLTSDHLSAPACAPCCSGPRYLCWLRAWS